MKYLFTSILSLCLVLALPGAEAKADISDYVAFVILSEDELTMDIGDELKLTAITSTFKKTQWKSSNSKVASVDSNGVVRAKKAGTAKITAKIKNADATCTVTVKKTTLTLNSKSVSLERGETFKLVCTTSNGSAVSFKTNKRSIATVSDDGLITAYKPGEAVITAKADGSTITCKVTVKKPTVKLSKSSVSLFAGESIQLTAQVSSTAEVKWKSNRSSVAMVDDTGKITAVKNGNAIITATVDGVKKLCEVTVKKPTIKLNKTELTLNVGDTYTLVATVDSKMPVEWIVNNEEVATVDANGKIRAVGTGKTSVYAKLDGTKVKCSVKVSKEK